MPTSSSRASCTTSATSGEFSKGTGQAGMSSMPLDGRQNCRVDRLTPRVRPITKLFAMDHLATSDVFDAGRIARAIDSTRFPLPAKADDEESEEASLLRAADLIGQLGDPQYLRKANALYHEFDEVGLNRQRGYTSSADIIEDRKS